MRFLSLAPLLGAVCNLCLSLFVLSSDRKSPLNQIFFFWGLCITVWNACTFVLFRTESASEAFLWARVMSYGVIFIPVSLLHLSMMIAEVRRPRLIALLYLFHAGLAVLNAMGVFIKGVRPVFTTGVPPVQYAWYSVADVGFWIYACTLIFTVISIVVLFRRRRILPPLQRKRLNGLIIAQTLLVVFGTNDILPILGIDSYPGTSVPVYPYGSIAAIFYGIIVGYSVLQHQLLDVHIALGRIAAHVVRFLFLFLIGLTLQITLTVLIQGDFSSVAFFGPLAVLMASTLIASILFPKLIGGRMETLERGLLGDRFEYQDQVRNFIESMTWYNDLNALFNDLHDLLSRTFRLKSYSIILRDETNRVFTLYRAYPEEPQRQLPELKAQSPLFQYFEWRNAEYLSLSLGYSRPGEAVLERQAREQMSGFDAEFCLPLVSETDHFGLLLVGEKANGELYTATDLNLLVALVKNLSLMVNQIRLKTQILHSQELDLLGRMSRGMAHDLNNLLTPVWTLLQLSMEGGNAQPLNEELLPVALRNVQTMRAYIKEALFFSEHLRPDLHLGQLGLVIRDAVEMARASRNKEIEIIADIQEEALVEMDSVLMQRLFANLISNAIDASPARSQVIVQLERLVKTEANRDWLRVKIIDQGEGIAKENLGKVLTPYFTTKDRGDESRGFGLGLAICRKIVNLHGGNLSIASQLRKGTTVQVDLPSSQLKQKANPVQNAA